MTTRFVILCQPRTGSSMLAAALRTHPRVAHCGEILNHRYGRTLPEYGGERLRAALHPDGQAQLQAVGCTFHCFQPDRGHETWQRWESAWPALAADPTIKIILLWRRNVIAQYCSWRIATLLQNWGDQQTVEERPRIAVSYQEFHWFSYWIRMVYEWRMGLLEQHQVLPITYETLCKRWERSIERIQRFLDVDRLPLERVTHKNEPREPSDIVTNWPEVRRKIEHRQRALMEVTWPWPEEEYDAIPT